MSQLPAKKNQALQKNPNYPTQIGTNEIATPPRDVTESLYTLPHSIKLDFDSNVITTYKDLSQPTYEKLATQKKQFMFVIAFIILISTILIGFQQITNQRSIASNQALVPIKK